MARRFDKWSRKERRSLKPQDNSIFHQKLFINGSQIIKKMPNIVLSEAETLNQKIKKSANFKSAFGIWRRKTPS